MYEFLKLKHEVNYLIDLLSSLNWFESHLSWVEYQINILQKNNLINKTTLREYDNLLYKKNITIWVKVKNRLLREIKKLN